MKGRPVTTAERAFHNALCDEVGCIACRQNGVRNHYVSVHHIFGRTKECAHWTVLPLCAAHHQQGTGPQGTEKVIAVHPNKALFESTFGSQYDLWLQCLNVVGIPEKVTELSQEISTAFGHQVL